jgi:hypothetical protein
MESNPTEAELRSQLARVRAGLTTLVERRLQFGLTPGEEADYRRLTNLERELLRSLDEGDAPGDAPRRRAEEGPGAGGTSPGQGPGGAESPAP